MSSTPQISGYEFDQHLLTHPLAELWRGRSFTGMEVVALVLSDAGARDAAVLERLVQAGRGAALEPGRQETPLWAANFTAGRPYAITQLVPGQSGAERLIDPLDGIDGNDEEALQAVRSQLSQYGAMPPAEDSTFPSYADPRPPTAHPQPTTAEPQPTTGRPTAGQPTTSQPTTGQQPTAAQPTPGQPPQPQSDRSGQQRSKVEVARDYRHKIGGWIYLVSILGVLVVFSITYSIGSAIGSSVKDEPVEAVPAPVSPSPFPTPVLLPGIARITTAKYQEPTGAPGVVGATYAAGTDVQPVLTAGLPFPFGWPQPPEVSSLGESSKAIYRRVVTETLPNRSKSTLETRIALHPCEDLATCLADRVAFDADWAKAFNAPTPSTAKDARTRFTEQKSEQKTTSYTLTLSHAFISGGQWWLVGVAASGVTGEERAVQSIVNDIWRQTG